MINRFEWLKGVLQADLSDRAKVLASALAIEFCNDGTGQLNPSLPTLARYLHVSEDTAKRAVSDLGKAGWLAKTVGRGRRNTTEYILLSPGNVTALRTVDRENRAAKRVQDCTPSEQEKGCRTADKRVQNCPSHIRKEQSYEQKTGERPAAHLREIVRRGSWQAEAWDAWLAQNGQPALEALNKLHKDGGYDLPWKHPPSSNDLTTSRVATSIIEWAKGKERSSHAA